MINGVTFDNQLVTSQNDGAVYEHLFTDGIQNGCTMSFSGPSLTIQDGQLIIAGRVIKMTGATTFDLSESVTDGYGQLVFTIDLTQESTQTDFQQVEAAYVYASTASFPALTQENINDGTGTTYQAEIAVVEITGGEITAIVSQLGATLTGAPRGGDTGQVLVKTGDGDFETAWQTLYTYGTEDLEAGVSELPTGQLYFMYE